MSAREKAQFRALDQDLVAATNDVPERDTIAAPFRGGLDRDPVAVGRRPDESRRGFDQRRADDAFGPLELEGAQDPATEARATPADLVDLGYKDAYRMFVEPVVGASGERVGQV